MEPTKNTTATAGSLKKNRSEQKGLDNWLNKQAERFERTRLGWMAIYITIQSCIGSIAVMHLLRTNASDLPLALCAMVTMACNAIFIAQGPPKWCLASFYISIVINITLILIHI